MTWIQWTSTALRGVISTFSWGATLFLFFNATWLLKNWKKNSTLYVVIWRYSFFSFFSFFLFFFLFFFFHGGGSDGLPAPLKWRLWRHLIVNDIVKKGKASILPIIDSRTQNKIRLIKSERNLLRRHLVSGYFQYYFQAPAISWGDPPESQIPFPQKNTQNTKKNIKNASNLPPPPSEPGV